MAYGERIESDFAFNSLPVADRTPQTIRISVERIIQFDKDLGTPSRPCTAQGRDVHIVAHSSYVLVQVDALMSVELWLSSCRIHCYVTAEVQDNFLKYWILQQILPLYLLLSGSTEFLHGMAVSSFPQRDRSLDLSSEVSCSAFLGASHAGKSTLLSYFLSQGHALVTDDHLALSRRDYTEVLPAIPFYRPYRAPEDLGRCAARYSPHPMRLRRLYLIEPAPPKSAIRIERLNGLEAVTSLFPNIHYSLHNPKKPDFFPMVEDRFHGLADIARRVPLGRLYIPRSLERLPEVYEFIQQDLVT